MCRIVALDKPTERFGRVFRGELRRLANGLRDLCCRDESLLREVRFGELVFSELAACIKSEVGRSRAHLLYARLYVSLVTSLCALAQPAKTFNQPGQRVLL